MERILDKPWSLPYFLAECRKVDWISVFQENENLSVNHHGKVIDVSKTANDESHVLSLREKTLACPLEKQHPHSLMTEEGELALLRPRSLAAGR